MHKQNTEKEKALPVVSLQLWWSTERNKARLLGRVTHLLLDQMILSERKTKPGMLLDADNLMSLGGTSVSSKYYYRYSGTEHD